MQYCRNKAESFEEFIFLMEKLGYKVGAHISVKAEGMRRSRRLDTLDEVYVDPQNFDAPYMTKERYEILTDKGKVDWLGIAECSVQDAIQRFICKLDSIGVVYRYSDDMLDEFMRLESVVAQMKRDAREAKKERERKKML